MVSDRLRLLEPARGSFFLFGARGSGKSTWLRQRFPKALRFDLLDETTFQELLVDPAAFGRALAAVRPGSEVVVDEVQRHPPLLNEVHRQIEERRLRFALSGSSARKLKSSGTNLLAGRAALRALHPYVPEELGDDFDLEAALRWGTLPIVWEAPDRDDALTAYGQLYLKQEIQAEALVRNLPGFARFLPVAALFHGQVISVSGLARDAGGARTTVDGYLEIVEDTLVAFRIPAYEARLRVRERRHPKLFFADAGIARALARRSGAPSPEERGALFEGWVAALLRAYRDYRGLFDDWWYWASGRGQTVEVDFLLRRGKRFAAIETKASARLVEADFRGLRAVAELPGLRRRIVVHPGQRPQRTQDGIEIFPAERFAALVANGELFD